MNTDSIYAIGKDHNVCEDYALTRVVDGLAYAIVCDGCSSSLDVDFGARVLAMSAERKLLNVVPYWDDPPNFFDNKLGEFIIQNAYRVYDIFPHLHPQALDATLLMAWVTNNKFTAIMYGDGVLVHKHKGKTDFIYITLSSGAPDYLSYHLDNSRKVLYDAMENNKKEILIRAGDKEDIRIYAPFDPFIYIRDVEEGDIIAVISDGINSFRNPDNTPIDFKDLLEEFTGFKTTEGEFVRRRINAFKRKCLKENITFSDDISIAAVIV